LVIARESAMAADPARMPFAKSAESVRAVASRGSFAARAAGSYDLGHDFSSHHGGESLRAKDIRGNRPAGGLQRGRAAQLGGRWRKRRRHLQYERDDGREQGELDVIW